MARKEAMSRDSLRRNMMRGVSHGVRDSRARSVARGHAMTARRTEMARSSTSREPWLGE